MAEAPVRRTPPRRSAPTRILVADDSPVICDAIAEILRAHPELQVVGRAADGEEALRLALELEPACICVDLQMPRMDGFTFLRLLMARKPTPVVVISSIARKQDVFKALELGALEYVIKPDAREERGGLDAVKDELLRKLLVVRALRVVPLAGRDTGEGRSPASAPRPSPSPRRGEASRLARRRGGGAPERVVVIGASTGGPGAVERLLAAMPRGLPVAYAVAQHMPRRFTESFAERLARSTGFDVRQASDGDELQQDGVLVAPGGHHLKLVRPCGPRSSPRAAVFPPDPRDGRRYCPSIDLLFESAAETMGNRVCAVVLTGMGSDGREGVAKVKAAGGIALAESEQTAVVFGMPRQAAGTGKVDEILSLDEIAARVRRFAEQRS